MTILQVSSTILVLALLYITSNYFSSGLQDIPGPFLAKISNLWRLIETWKGGYEQVIQDLHRRHGNIIRVGPNVVSLADPDDIEKIYGNKADLRKSDFYKVMQNYHNGKVVPTLLTVIDKGTHTRLRKPVNGIFAMSTVAQFESLVDHQILELIKILRERYAAEQRDCDIDNWLQFFALDVISELSFSRSFGFLKHGYEATDMMKNLARIFKYCAIVGQMPRLDRVLGKNPILRWLPSNTSPFSIRAGNLFRDRVADEKVGKGAHRQDFVARILEIQKARPREIADEAVIGYIMTILLAGSDTVSITLRSIIYYLANNPSIQLKLQTEIDALKPDYPVSWKDVQEMVYLDAVVREALRVHPPTSILLERVVSSSGLTLSNGWKLKQGNIVSMNGWALKQDRDLYGQDADDFNPDRWLKLGDEPEAHFQERIRKMKRADLAFGYGPRSCMGKAIAHLEIYKLVPTIFGQFDVKLSSPEKTWRYLSYFVTSQYDMDVQLSWRNSKAKSVNL